MAQRAIVTVPEPVHEADFLPCPYGFRPGRPARDAPGDLREGLAVEGLRRVTGADVGSCPDRIDRRRLRDLPDLRIRDGVTRRMIDRWLKAGVPDSGVLQRPDTGTPRGGAVSPILPNVFLHHVLDGWMMETVRPRVGAFRLVRHADDFVIAFRSRRDGERVLAVPGARLARSGLSLHPTRTRYVDFRPTAGGHDTRNRSGFPGFTHLWGKSRRGRRVVRRFTAKARLARAVKTVWNRCREHRHMPLGDQCRHLAGVIRGHCACYGLTGNGKRLSAFRTAVPGSRRRWPGRRHRNGSINWERFNAILARFPLSQARVKRSIYAP